MIKISGLTKRFDRRTVLDDVTLDIPSGAVTAILGPNASGKSTLIKSVLGLVRPDAGDIQIDGKSILGGWKYRAGIGYMPQTARFPDNLTVDEVFSMLKGLRTGVQELDIELFARFDLGAVGHQRLCTLSGGTRQKINAAIACLFSPSILVLDEPTVGLDPMSSTILKDKVARDRDAGRTVILTSHLLGEIGELADRIVYLLDGRPFYVGTVDDLRRATAEERLDRAITRVMEDSHASRS